MVEGGSGTVMEEKCFNYKFLFINQVKKKSRLYWNNEIKLILTYDIFTPTFGFSIGL